MLELFAKAGVAEEEIGANALKLAKAALRGAAMTRVKAATPEQRDRRYRRTYGISLEEYEAKLAAQGGACAICGATSPNYYTGHFLVDHDHDTGAVRDLLCRDCNTLVGFLEKREGRVPVAQHYIARHRGLRRTG